MEYFCFNLSNLWVFFVNMYLKSLALTRSIFQLKCIKYRLTAAESARCPGPAGGAYSASHAPSRIKGRLLLRERYGKTEDGRGEGEGEGTGGGPPPFMDPTYAPAWLITKKTEGHRQNSRRTRNDILYRHLYFSALAERAILVVRNMCTTFELLRFFPRVIDKHDTDRQTDRQSATFKASHLWVVHNNRRSS